MAPAGILFEYGTGQKGAGVGEDRRRKLRQPRGICVCADGSLLVSDYGNHCVFRFAPGEARGRVVAGEEGKMLPTVDPLKDLDRPLGPAEGEGHLLKRPAYACEDQEGGLLVLDMEECRVQRFGGLGGDAAGRATRVVPPPNAPEQKSVNSPEAVKYPRAMLPLPDGGLILCDTWSHRVLRYPAARDAVAVPVLLAGKANSTSQQPDQLCFPSGVALNAEGGLLVTDTNNHRVLRFDLASNGEMLASGTVVAGSLRCKPGLGREELNMPTGICIDPTDGSFVVADRANSRVLRFPAHARAGDPGEVIAGPDVLEYPWGVCFDADGALYVSDERLAVVLKLEVGSGQVPTLDSNITVASPLQPTAPVSTAQANSPRVARQAEEAIVSTWDDPMQLD